MPSLKPGCCTFPPSGAQRRQVTKCSDRLSSTQEKAPAEHTFRTPAQRKALSLSRIFAATFFAGSTSSHFDKVISIIDEVLHGWKGRAIGQIVAHS